MWIVSVERGTQSVLRAVAQPQSTGKEDVCVWRGLSTRSPAGRMQAHCFPGTSGVHRGKHTKELILNSELSFVWLEFVNIVSRGQTWATFRCTSAEPQRVHRMLQARLYGSDLWRLMIPWAASSSLQGRVLVKSWASPLYTVVGWTGVWRTPRATSSLGGDSW